MKTDLHADRTAIIETGRRLAAAILAATHDPDRGSHGIIMRDVGPELRALDRRMMRLLRLEEQHAYRQAKGPTR